MKVLNVCVSLDPVNGGGVAERTFRMSRYLSRFGIKCAILSTDLGLTAERREALKEIELIIFPCLNARFYIPKISYRKVKDAIQDADIVHLSDYWSLQNIVIYLLSRYFHKPYVICAAGSLGVYGRSKFLKRLYNNVFGRRIIRHAAACIAITNEEIPLYKNYGAGQDKIFVIPNGTSRSSLMKKDDEKFRSKFKLGTNPIILFMGRLNYIKGPDLLLQAFCNLKESLHNYLLVFAGPDQGMLTILEDVVVANSLEERVRFIGFLGNEDKSLAYYASELLVIPSRQEAMSIVVLEAGITGTPVLLTDRCGFNVVEDINGGRVVPATVEGLQNGLLSMLAERGNLKAMGTNLEKYVVSRFMWESIVGQHINLYRKILDKKQSARSQHV